MTGWGRRSAYQPLKNGTSIGMNRVYIVRVGPPDLVLMSDRVEQVRHCRRAEYIHLGFV
jgi:hypothetical protein